MDYANELQLYKKARAHLILNEPFYGSLAARLEPIPDPTCKTLWTNAVSIGFNPTFIASIPFDQLKSEICHEVEHVARGHCWRRDGRNAKKWNYATDYEINPNLKASGFMLGTDWLLDAQYAGMPAEQIFTMIPNPPDDGGGGLGNNDSPGGGEVRDAPNGETETLKSEWQVATIQAANVAKAYGKLPAGVSELVNDLRKSRVDWRNQLRVFPQQFAKADYTWTLPNRRYLPNYLPALRSRKLGPIVVYVDTSGSRYHSEAKTQAIVEVREVINECQPEFTLVVCGDTHVQSSKRFEPNDPIDVDLKGGGGTNFTPIFEHIAAQDFDPVCFIGITDLNGNFPNESPLYPVLWCAVGDSEAPFGEIIRVKD